MTIGLNEYGKKVNETHYPHRATQARGLGLGAVPGWQDRRLRLSAKGSRPPKLLNILPSYGNSPHMPNAQLPGLFHKGIMLSSHPPAHCRRTTTRRARAATHC